MELLELFQGVYHIDNPAVLRRLRDTVQVCRLKKGEVYLHEGERQSRVMLLWSGIVRGYYTDVNGSEHTDCFCARRGSPAMPPCGLYDPSPINLMTLTEKTYECFEAIEEELAVYDGWELAPAQDTDAWI